MTTYAITVPGQPVGKGRPRFVRATGRAFTPERTVRYESLVALAAAPVLPRFGDGVALEVEILFAFERPKRLTRRRDHDGLIAHLARPDIDNASKALLDGLAAHFRDEQVTKLSARKAYAERGGQPRTEIVVREIKE